MQGVCSRSLGVKGTGKSCQGTVCFYKGQFFMLTFFQDGKNEKKENMAMERCYRFLKEYHLERLSNTGIAGTAGREESADISAYKKCARVEGLKMSGKGKILNPRVFKV